MNIYKELSRRVKEQGLKSGDTLIVSPDEMEQALYDANEMDPYPNKPKPPVKSESVSYGFFFEQKNKEYDLRHPEYLRALEEYENRARSWHDRNRRKKDISIYTHVGPILLKVES